MSLDVILAKQDKTIDAQVNAFTGELTKMLHKAQNEVMAELMDELDVADGKILFTAANRKVLRNVGEMMMDSLNELGVNELVNAYVSKFNDQFGFFKQILEQTLSKAEAELITSIKLTSDQTQFLAMTQVDAATSIKDVLSASADRIKDKMLLQVGGAPLSDLTGMFVDELGKLPGQAKSIAATSHSMFYRTLANLQFKDAEDDKNYIIRYRYVGPPSTDPLERPFCRRLMAQSADGRTWTRGQIDAMDNGQLSNVFVTGGGYNCRHQWIIANVDKR